ncbi:translation factor pelota [Methanocaldococcus vulcanius M7]|uniref:Protein pelota homolog n=1 Tax=Methanocaldococcus vulcanius (strain ATCC 700851 / DSM 12094 / M7) TaxID=579137 RepID=C9RDZ0_METVM|nr:mRNA surveillance protein pelota [Methanocaldococcus vulcanius]ACX73519.1 translation factor pelota [Methanocaldococcus vulcanius M7]
MKIIKEIPQKQTIKLMPENLDDLWVIYNIIEEGDKIFAITERRVQDKGDMIRADRGAKKKMFLGIETKNVEFDENTKRVRILGTIISGPEDVPLGSHHTIEVKPYDEISIQKEWKKWQIERIKDAINSSKRPKVLVVIMDDEEAEIFEIRDYNIKEICSIKSHSSKKLDYKINEELKKEYYHEIAKVLSEYDVDNILVAGPGFAKNSFYNFISSQYPELKRKIVVESISTTSRAGMNEVIKRGIINRIYKESRVAKETQLIEKLLEEIAKKGLAVYGIDEVKKALEYSAIDTLLVSDSFVRNREIEEIISRVEEMGGKVVIVSSEHDSGKQLKALGGIAGLLRFPIE